MPSPVADAVVDAFKTAMTRSTSGGTATITGIVDMHDPTSEPQPIRGSLQWRGRDVEQVLHTQTTGRTPGVYKDTIVLGEDVFVLVCPAPDCLEHLSAPFFQEAYWSTVPDTGHAPYSLVALLEGAAALGHAGSEVHDGRTLERLVTMSSVDQPAAFGFTGYFGRPQDMDGFSADVTVLVDAAGLLVVIRAAASWNVQGGRATMTLEADVTSAGDAAQTEPSAPPPSRTLAYVQTGHGYEIAVPADWRFVAGKIGGIDRFVAPTASDRREIRLHLDAHDAATLDDPTVGDGLKDVFEQLYGIRPGLVAAGWHGAAAGVSVSEHVLIDGAETWIVAGPIQWAGCVGGVSGCTNTWSLLEMRSKPGHEDADRDFLSRLSSTFIEDAAQE